MCTTFKTHFLHTAVFQKLIKNGQRMIDINNKKSFSGMLRCRNIYENMEDLFPPVKRIYGENCTKNSFGTTHSNFININTYLKTTLFLKANIRKHIKAME